MFDGIWFNLTFIEGKFCTSISFFLLSEEIKAHPRDYLDHWPIKSFFCVFWGAFSGTFLLNLLYDPVATAFIFYASITSSFVFFQFYQSFHKFGLLPSQISENNFGS